MCGLMVEAVIGLSSTRRDGVVVLKQMAPHLVEHTVLLMKSFKVL